MVDIYIKNEFDNHDYDPMEMDISRDIEMYLQQLQILFSTEIGEVLGAPDMSVNLDDYIYEYGASEIEIRQRILESISKYIPISRNFKTNAIVKFSKGTVRDIVFIDILIDDIKRLELRIS